MLEKTTVDLKLKIDIWTKLTGSFISKIGFSSIFWNALVHQVGSIVGRFQPKHADKPAALPKQIHLHLHL